MTHIPDYQLENLRKRELRHRAQRRDILISAGEQALEKILDAPSPATLVQSFPDQDLYYLMHKIGPEDFVPVLSLASSDQWEYILDVDVWDGDTLDPGLMNRMFDLLFQADPQRLLRWGIKEKTAFFEFYLARHMTVKIREHDEPPPSDFNDYITIDDKFYFRFPEKPSLSENQMPVPRDSQSAWELIEKMLKRIARMDLSVFHGLLLETAGLLPAEVEEEEFRLKNLRLAEKGFLPTHEAIGIYQPVPSKALRERPGTFGTPQVFDPEIPLPPQFFIEHFKEEDLFITCLKYFEPLFVQRLESEIAALINKVISADKIKLRSRKDLDKAVQKTRAYLNLGFETLLAGNPGPGAARQMVARHFLEDVFRVGSGACIKLKTLADKWFSSSFMNQHNLPLSFLDETFLGVIGGLLIDRPMFYDKTNTGSLYRDFKTVSELKSTQESLEQIIAIDTVLGLLPVDVASFKKGILTYKTLILTLWAKNRLGLPSTLDPINIKVFKTFFTALFPGSGKKCPPDLQLNDLGLWVCETTQKDPHHLPEAFGRVLRHLMAELQQEYGGVSPEDIDPRFIPHFLLEK